MAAVKKFYTIIILKFILKHLAILRNLFLEELGFL